jgi:hypothetical protein
MIISKGYHVMSWVWSFLKAIVLCSKKKFEITKQGDAGALLPWILNFLHMALGETFL